MLRPRSAPDALALELEPEDGPLWARAGLFARYTWQAALPSTLVLFDGAARAFATDRYLTPGPAEGYASGLAFVSAGWEATSWLGFRLDVDSGLVRSQRFPTVAVVCPSTTSPSGLALTSGGACTAPARYDLATTTYGASEITTNGQSFSTEASQTAFIRQLYVEASAGRAGAFHARLGRQRLRIADGFVYDDWGLGLDLDLDVGAFGPPLAFSASVFYPSRAWPSGSDWQYPVVSATAEWTPSLGEWVGIWGAWSSDSERGRRDHPPAGARRERRGGAAAHHAGLGRLPRRLAPDGEPPDRADAGQLQPGLARRVRPARALLLERGEVHRGSGLRDGGDGRAERHVDHPVDVPTLGWLLSGRLVVQPGSGFTVSPFFVWLTGDSSPSTQQILSGSGSWGGFLAISPYITATNLFFQGGISESYANRQASASGVNARGVVAPGLEVRWTRGTFDATAKAAWLWADEASAQGGVSYGPEFDLNLAWSPVRWLSVLAEADVLAMGNFFPGQGVARKFILGVNVSTP